MTRLTLLLSFAAQEMEIETADEVAIVGIGCNFPGGKFGVKAKQAVSEHWKAESFIEFGMEEATCLPFSRTCCCAACGIFLKGGAVLETTWLQFVCRQTDRQTDKRSCSAGCGQGIELHMKLIQMSWMDVGWFEFSACSLAAGLCNVTGLSSHRDRSQMKGWTFLSAMAVI